MSLEERAEIAASLKKQLIHLLKEVEATRESLQPVATQCSKSDPQRAELMQNQEIIYKNFAIAEKRYNSLLHTQKHLEDEDYGLCQDCDDNIAYKRLLLMPEAKYCVDCANERDR